MSSGVKVDDECKREYNNIKLKKTYRYIIFSLSDDMKSIIIRKKAPPEATYEEFVEELKDAEEKRECRYAIYDMPYVARGQESAKLVFFFWSPENAQTKQKMVYAASKDALKRELGEGLAAMIQANDFDDLKMSDIVDKLHKD